MAAQWPALVALLCEEVAQHTDRIRQELDRLLADGRLNRREAAAMRHGADVMCKTSVTVQQIVRLGAGAIRSTAERVDLTQLARQLVQERQQELARAGAEIRIDIRPAEVLVDAAAAVELANAALDWALSFSSKIRLKIEQGAASEPVRLVVRGSLNPPSQQPAGHVPNHRRMNDNLHWILLRQLAAMCKLGISRSSTAATESAVIEFPRTFFCTGGLSSVELLAGGTAQAQLGNAWVLAIVRDRALRESVLKLMLRHGLEASAAENCEQARQLCASRKPRVLVGCFESLGVPELRREFALDGQACAFVQILREAPSFHAQGFSGYEWVKIGRRQLDKELIPALLFELAQQA